MNSVVATPQQQAIIDSTEPRFIVRAAAGSGKTFVLVHRYLRHLLVEGCDPRSILAFTFTAKAAAEMRMRVVKELRERDKPELAQAAETGPISTIHSFCERLLRENALEAGIDPEFEISGEAETLEFQRAAVREVLTNGEATKSPEVLDLIGELTGRMSYGTTGPYDFLEKAVLDVLRSFRGAGLAPTDLLIEGATAQTIKELWHTRMAESLDEPVASVLRPHIGKPSFYPAALELSKVSTGNRRGTRPPWLKDGSPSTEEVAARNTLALAELTAEAWSRLEAKMFAQQQLDFAALERRAVRLLRESEPTARRARLTYKHVLVDEAQDLNPMQHRLIDAINPESLMLVGDGQQSIYGFRQADLAMFEKKVSELPTWELTKNHRSEPPILRFVDTVAISLWGQGYTPMQPAVEFDLDAPAEPDYGGVELWLTPRTSALTAAAQGIRSLIEDGVRPKEIGVLTRSWTFATNVVKELANLGIQAKLAGGNSRFYARLEIRDLANLLRVMEDPTDDFSFLAVLHSPLASLSLDSIAALGAAGKVFENLQSFVPSIPEDEPKLRRFLSWMCPLMERSGWMTAWETLSELLATSDYLNTLAARPRKNETLANVRKLLLLAAERPDLGPAEFAERMADIDSLRHREQDASVVDEDADAVSVLTIHSAKGLEYPVVVVPDTFSSTTTRMHDFEIDTRLMAFSPHLEPNPSPFHVHLGRNRQARDRKDGERLLYVALTRAGKRLAVVTHAQAKEDTFAGILARAVGLSGKSMPAGYRIRNFDTRDSASTTGNLD